MENTLLIGNGFSRTLVKDIPSWDQLLDKLKNEKAKDETVSEKTPEDKAPEDFDDSQLSNTLRYEKAVIKRAKATADGKKMDQTIKSELASKLKTEGQSLEKDYEDYLPLFGELLYRHNITNILTTNYEGLIESILVDKCGYTDATPDNGSIMTCQCAKDDKVQCESKEYIYTEEDLYNIRTRKVYTKGYPDGSTHAVKLWKIHGDALRKSKKYDDATGASMILGFDQYCGQLSKLWAYLKGGYKSDDIIEKSKDTEIDVAKCNTPMEDKIKNNQFDGISWAELFFNSNVYIAGFGMDYAEIDLWWLINQRARMKYVKDVKNLNNKICFLYHPIYDNPAQQPEMKSRIRMLECFDVECKPINIFCRTKLTKTKIEVDSHTGEDRIVSFENTDPVGYLEGIFALIPERTS